MKLTDFVIFNGEVTQFSEISLKSFQAGFFWGAGFFETFLIQQGQPQRLDLHLVRLQNSLQQFTEVIPSPLDFNNDIFVAANNITNNIRRLCKQINTSHFTGIGKISVSDGNTLISFRELPADYYIKIESGIEVSCFDKRTYRKDDQTLQHKTLSYLRQYQFLAQPTIFLNEYDEVCETETANIFIQHKGKILTPSISSPCLPGIIRQIILAELKERASVTTILQSQLLEAESCVLTNSVSLIIPVHRIGNKRVPNSNQLAATLRTIIESV